jgi:transcription antitermination protein NusB
VSERGLRRHRARERALEILYEASIKQRPIHEVLGELRVAPDEYTVTLLLAAEAQRARSDDLISRHAKDWSLERLAIIDRLIMTLAIAELLLEDAPPTAVILDEAVELARAYSTEGSASFVNGVLSACVDELR